MFKILLDINVLRGVISGSQFMDIFFKRQIWPSHFFKSLVAKFTHTKDKKSKKQNVSLNLHSIISNMYVIICHLNLSCTLSHSFKKLTKMSF